MSNAFAKSLVIVALSSGAAAPSVLAAPPANDDCAGAVVIRDGPYPVVTWPIDALEATPQGVDDGGLFPASCNSWGTDYTVWYTFTPAFTTLYTFTTCPSFGASADTLLDTVIAIFSSSDGTCGGAFTSVACNDSAICAPGGDWSTIFAILTAGTTYYVVAGHWLPDGAIPPGNSTYQFVVTRTCAGHSCDDGNPCTDDSVSPGDGCFCQHLWSLDGTPCEDGNACTVGNTCSSGVCGTSVAPPEVRSLEVAADKVTLTWGSAPNATSYDVVRGLVSDLPVGPGEGDEACFGGLADPTVADATVPADGAGFWYLVRGVNSGCGTFGMGSDGTARVTSTCP